MTDDYNRLYAGADNLPVVRAMRSIHALPSEILEGIDFLTFRDRGDTGTVGPPVVSDLLHDTQRIIEELEHQYVTHLGPTVTFRAPSDTVELGTALIDAVTFDDYYENELDLSEGSHPALEDAARAYQRECRWDFAPNLVGSWLLYLLPVSGWGGDDYMHYTAQLAGFIIVYDRDEDGAYESLGHIWTAQHLRRRGVASRLLAEARRRYPLVHAEAPVTDSGAALLHARWPASLGEPEPHREERS